MECNKEEARRAKDLAEKKMIAKDFLGARKFVLKAQQLHPEMENISRLLSVCDVHCAASKMFGNEMDWYGILQVAQNADDTMIKKQYRKFALLLHPDKNQFAGAEAAFKLVGEAQRILLDAQKRSLHDMKRKMPYKPAIPRQQPSQQANCNGDAVRQTMPMSNIPSNHNAHSASNVQQQKQMPQSQPANSQETFWTLCLHCSVRFQYYKSVIGMALRCPKCQKPFVAYDMHASKSGALKPVSKQGVKPSNNVGPDTKNAKPSSNAGFQAGQNGSNKVHTKGDDGSKQQRNGQKRKIHVESSESYESDSSVSEVEGFHETVDPGRSEHFDSNGNSKARRSTRNKQHVSYDENASGDEQVATPAKKHKVNGSTEENVEPSKDFGSACGKEGKNNECKMDDQNENETVSNSTDKTPEEHDEHDSSKDLTSDSTPEPTYVEYPDPEFCDFEKSREERCFKVGQIWAAYDTVDAMPRFYAKIKKIFPSGFKLQITWLESDPTNEVEMKWADSELPYSCGKFMIGETATTEDRLMFSHVVSGCKAIGKTSFTIYPRVGETWAVFKNWDPKWYSIPEDERKYEYDFVEVLSDYDKIVGIRVAPLYKLKGFASLFCRKTVNEMHIQPSELLRFSHMVPSYTTTGNEKKKVPKGFLELDPASTTLNIDEFAHPELDRKACVNDLSSKLPAESGTANVTKNSKVKQKNGLK